MKRTRGRAAVLPGMTIIAAIFLAMLATGCSGADSTKENTNMGGIPRPVAYPRIPLYAPNYSDHGLPAGFMVNSYALVDTVDGNFQWIDVHYPAYGATLHTTFSPVESSNKQAVVDNRLERISLNIGDNFARQTEVNSNAGDFQTLLFETSGQTLTPLQFISIGERWVISGVLQFDNAGATTVTDSIQPIINAVGDDIIHAALNL